MGLRFSQDGPEFPSKLVEALQQGKVVFLCGAGVSAPQLPGFGKLVEDVYKRIGIKKTAAEVSAIKLGRFEEALGALSRRLVDPKRVEDIVSQLLSIQDPSLSNHKVLLRLSRGLDNRLALVTTNFDALFERALDEMYGAGNGRQESLAGQALPAPGAEDFRGVIHLHGRIADEATRTEATPLVLRSSDYGDAYMRSGWAARFLFDLVRCRTLVLIGYGAGDAPVRYFLNVLEADRARFNDLQSVYAFDAVEKNLAQADARWDAVAVMPLPYRLGPKDASNRHESLWRDLNHFADIIERPKVKRRARAEAIFSEPYEATIRTVSDEVLWLLQGKRDLWDIVIAKVADPRWFEHFTKHALWENSDACWVVATWCRRDWSDITRLEVAIYWHGQLGLAFCEALDLKLTDSSAIAYPYALAWRFLRRCSQRPPSDDIETYRVSQRLRRTDRVDGDLSDAVALLTPHASFRSIYRVETGQDETPRNPTRLADIVRVDLNLADKGGLPDLTNAIREIAPTHAGRLAEIASEALRKTIAIACEAELIVPGWDSVSTYVPSVEAHAQNNYHDGAVFLVVLLTDLLAIVADSDHSRGRALAEAWREIPSLIGARMWLHALRRPDLYSCDEVASAILSLSKEAFWSIRRELILAMEERLFGANSALIAQIYQRILDESQTLYADLENAASGQTDWRPQARCHVTWLRLTALRRAGVLPDGGEHQLKAIAVQYPYIDGDYSESDLFSSYMTGVSSVRGDPSPLMGAAPDERLEIAHSLSAAWDPNTQRNWSAYCSADPVGALEALKRGGFGEADVPLWNDLLNIIAFAPQTPDGSMTQEHLPHEIFALLESAEDQFIGKILRPLTDLLGVTKTVEPRVRDEWWDRLWAASEASDEPIELREGERFHHLLINRTPGRLAEQLLSTIDVRKKASAKVSSGDKLRLSRIFDSPTTAGWLARGACAHDAGFVLQIDRRSTLKKFKPWLAQDNVQGATLRSVMVQYAGLGPTATRAFKKELLKGVLDSQLSDESAVHVASLLLRPLINEAMTQGRTKWGISKQVVRDTLSHAPDGVLEGAASCLSRWIGGLDVDPATAWRDYIAPIFNAVWPTERRFKRPAITRHLAELCVGAGTAFPDAFGSLRHYLGALGNGWLSLHFLDSSSAPTQYPAASLDLLWILCGPASHGQSSELGKILDSIVAAEPTLEVDRRLQWLEQKAIRYG